ncbi:Leucine Rich repeats (2 copies) [Symmachiella dynata]|uniref:Leucine Rich repeats (2 copies) n=1 Tax=Symmachiella dynata TaxID=2527995 RepID=A0A517ZH70_9PLAN|nr:leucine-rich repeat domain-containing protein [Symmachiella dynata]QDU41792.1 Leucine Rich repeats (2 copies) [Symmachiella dynata]
MSTLESPPVHKRPNTWRWIALAILLLGAVVVVKVVIPVYRQERAIAKIESAGFGTIVQSERIGPDWLWKDVAPARWRGFDRVNEITQPRFIGFTMSMMIMNEYIGKPRRLCEITYSGVPKIDLVAADLQAVSGPSLRELDLRHMRVQPTILDGSSDATNLEYLDLAATNIDDHSLKQISQFDNLKFLYLEKTKITGAGLNYLGKLTSLQELALDDTDISDSGLLTLGNLHDLRKLWLSNTKITDDGLRALEKMPHLEILDLTGTNATDAGVRKFVSNHTSKLAALRSLFLYNTRITDQLLPHLRGLGKLEYLDLNGTAVTWKGIRTLEEKIPGCEIQGGLSTTLFTK